MPIIKTGIAICEMPGCKKIWSHSVLTHEVWDHIEVPGWGYIAGVLACPECLITEEPPPIGDKA